MTLMVIYLYTCWLWPIVFVVSLIKAIHLYPKTAEERAESNSHYPPIILASVALFFMTAFPAFAIMSAS